ncbi:hypothetical protein JCM3774_000689 [Rhodotorula dairenensis]
MCKRDACRALETPTTAVGYEGRAEQTLYYSSGTLLAAHREATRQGHRFRNRLAEELSSDIAEDSALKATIEVLSRLNPTNEWRQLRSEIERRAELQRAAAQILDSLLGGERERRTTGQLGESKLVVFVGDGGGGVRKGSRGPNPSNRLVRELQLEAQARGIDARFVLTPETLTSQRCSKPWASIMQYEDGEACFAVLRCETCRVIVNRDAGGGANIMNQGVSSCSRLCKNASEIRTEFEEPLKSYISFNVTSAY